MSTFKLSAPAPSGPPCLQALRTATPGALCQVDITVSNTGKLDGDIVLLAYVKAQRSDAEWAARRQAQGVKNIQGRKLLTPRRTLYDYQRIRDVKAGDSRLVSFNVSAAALAEYDEVNGDLVSEPGPYQLLWEDGSKSAEGYWALSAKVIGKKAVLEPFPSDKPSGLKTDDKRASDFSWADRSPQAITTTMTMKSDDDSTDGFTGTSGKKNVLFFAVDDLRPEIGAYNASLAYTPHLDKLASQGLLLKRAYVQYAFCAPSRNSFMSGRRPDTTRDWNFKDDFRESGIGADWQSMPQYFLERGYLTMGSGKLYHPGVPADNDYAKSWSKSHKYFCPECVPPSCPNSSARGPANGAFECVEAYPEVATAPQPCLPSSYPYCNVPHGSGKATFCAANTSKDESRDEFMLEDQKIAASCISQLLIAKNTVAKTPFFVGCGFHKPHVPWIFPKEFLAHYPAGADVPLAKNTFAPQGMPAAAWHTPADVRGFVGTFNLSANGNATLSRQFRRGYYAAVSYTDYNVGKVLAELKALGLEQNTVVMLIGDHGWQLGDHNTWAKMVRRSTRGVLSCWC